jgi:hypothetical protein
MIPYEVDPSLHDAEPPPALLGDGFSPPAAAPGRGEQQGHSDGAGARPQAPLTADELR